MHQIKSGNEPGDDIMGGPRRGRLSALKTSRGKATGIAAGAVLTAGMLAAASFIGIGRGSGMHSTGTGTLRSADGASPALLPSLAAAPQIAVMPRAKVPARNTAPSVSDSGGGAVIYGPINSQTPKCDLNATPSNFTSQVLAATTGQTVCLASGSYGNWTGSNKAITVAAASGATPTMSVNFSSGASSFTLDGISGLQGGITGNANNITIQNSTFNGQLYVDMDKMENANIVFSHDHFPAFVGTARLMTSDYNASGPTGATPSGVIVENSLFDNPEGLSGVADGVRCDGASIEILNNSFSGINDAPSGGNHGDPIQIYGGTHCIMKGNYFHDMIRSTTCSLGEWDGGDDNVFENNVVHSGGCYEAIGILADHNSLIEHNTFIAPSSGCFVSQSSCAGVSTGAKSGSTGSGTIYRDNVMAGIGNGGGGVNVSYSEDHNLCLSSCGGGMGDIIGSPTLVGGDNPTTWAGYELAPGSDGKAAASDGTDMGIN